MTRGGPMGGGSRGGGGFHPGMRGRGILRGVPPRGMGFHHRGGPPRGGGSGLPTRGRPPMYNNQGPHYQSTHGQSMNNQGPPQSSQPPPPAEGTPPTVVSSASASSQSAVKPIPSSGTAPSSGPPSGPSNGGTSNGVTLNTQSGGPPSSRGAPRGRGGLLTRGRGGSYTPNIHVSGGVGGGGSSLGGGDMSGPPPQKPYRGGPPRGRGSYQMGMSRPPPVIQSGMTHTQGAPVPSLKRGPPVGPIGAKRGRYDQSGPPARPYINKYSTYSQQQVPTHQPHTPQHNNYYNQSSQSQK